MTNDEKRMVASLREDISNNSSNNNASDGGIGGLELLFRTKKKTSPSY